MQSETNTKIAIRGRGSVKEGATRDPKCVLLAASPRLFGCDCNTPCLIAARAREGGTRDHVHFLLQACRQDENLLCAWRASDAA